MPRQTHRHVTLLLLSAVASLVLVGPSRSQDMRGALGSECFARAYSADHLARHSRQIVTRMQLMDASDIPDGRGVASSAFRVHIEVDLRGRRGTGAVVGYCRPDGRDLSCDLEGDAGAVTLTSRPDGRLALAVTSRGMIVETDTASHDLAGSDDRLFLLQPSTGCIR